MVELKELTSTEFSCFQKFIYEMSGIRIPDTKRILLSNRVRRRLKAGGFDDYQSYFRYLKSTSGRSELTGFLDTVTTNETSFFRTEKHFEWFQSEFINKMVTQARSGQRRRKLRIWSAACSTGEEPFSIAICLAENQLRLRDWRLEIVATDLCEDVLQAAREGVYKERTVQCLDEKRRRRHFTKLKNEPLWQIKPNLKELVSFRRHNLMEPFEKPAFDCILIRNVLIYFDRQSKQRVVDNLIGAMAEGGYLVVGPSEGIYDMLQGLTKHSMFLYQK
jgi:chemotaxis protein methyltransferase CheR